MHVDSFSDISVILEQLRTSRKTAVPETEQAAMRVATLNFIVFVDDPTHREWVLERACRVAGKHPSRLIVLDSTNATTGLNVATSSRCSDSTTVVNERVDIGVGSIAHGSIVSLAHELAVPDIPIVLWWSGARLLQSRTFSGLAQFATTVLVDSSGKASGEETIRELGEFLVRFPNTQLQDLAFLRLAPWLETIAQFFDDPALRVDLFALDALEIESGSEAEALYLGGWLGSRLSWEPAGRNAFRDRAGAKIRFTTTAKGDKRRVRSVVLRTSESTYRAELSDDDSNVVALFVEGAKAKPVSYVPLQAIDNTSLIEQAIIVRGRDQIFETSLLTVRELLG